MHNGIVVKEYMLNQPDTNDTKGIPPVYTHKKSKKSLEVRREGQMQYLQTKAMRSMKDNHRLVHVLVGKKGTRCFEVVTIQRKKGRTIIG